MACACASDSRYSPLARPTRRRRVRRAGRHRARALEKLGHGSRRPAARHEGGARLGGRGRRLDERDHRIDVGERHREALEDVGALAGLGEIEDRAAGDHLAPVADEGIEHVLQRHQLRLPVLQRHHVDAEHRLHRRLRIEVVEDDLAHLAALQLDDDAHAVLVRFIAQAVAGDAFDQLLAHELRDALDQARLVDLIRQLGDDDGLPVALADLLDAHPGSAPRAGRGRCGRPSRSPARR